MKTLPFGPLSFASGARASSYRSQVNTRPVYPDGATGRGVSPGGVGRDGRSPSSSPAGTPSTFGASVKPSCQNSFTAGMLPRAGKSYRITDFFGNMKLLVPSFDTHSTLVGDPS